MKDHEERDKLIADAIWMSAQVCMTLQRLVETLERLKGRDLVHVLVQRQAKKKRKKVDTTGS